MSDQPVVPVAAAPEPSLFDLIPGGREFMKEASHEIKLAVTFIAGLQPLARYMFGEQRGPDERRFVLDQCEMKLADTLGDFWLTPIGKELIAVIVDGMASIWQDEGNSTASLA